MKTRYEHSRYYDNDEKAKPATIEEMVGKVMLLAVLSPDKEELTFTDTSGVRYVFYHDQDCCERVVVDDIDGDLRDLVGHPIGQAECVSSERQKDDEGYGDSQTWTFYKFATMKGHVTVKWLGTSNGYYSEHVDFRIEEP